MNKAIIGVVAASFAAAGTANAQIVIDIIDSGGNVEATLSGSIDLAATQGYIADSTGYDGFLDSLGAISFTGNNTNFYGIDVGTWTPFGSTGNFFNWDSSYGNGFAMFSDPVLGVPAGYQSGDALSGGGTMFGTSIAALGMDEGSWVTTLTGPSGVVDTVTVNIGIPAPGTAALLGLGGLAATRRRR
ncbi:MAG: PEP-CTERM sorting domain-containing protein [Phycisphaerales bacterium JB054]